MCYDHALWTRNENTTPKRDMRVPITRDQARIFAGVLERQPFPGHRITRALPVLSAHEHAIALADHLGATITTEVGGVDFAVEVTAPNGKVWQRQRDRSFTCSTPSEYPDAQARTWGVVCDELQDAALIDEPAEVVS